MARIPTITFQGGPPGSAGTVQIKDPGTTGVEMDSGRWFDPLNPDDFTRAAKQTKATADMVMNKIAAPILQRQREEQQYAQYTEARNELTKEVTQAQIDRTNQPYDPNQNTDESFKRYLDNLRGITKGLAKNITDSRYQNSFLLSAENQMAASAAKVLVSDTKKISNYLN